MGDYVDDLGRVGECVIYYSIGYCSSRAFCAGCGQKFGLGSASELQRVSIIDTLQNLHL